MVPQFLPCAAQLVGLHTHWPPTQVLEPEQLPQFKVPPQPSEMPPQLLPCAAQLVLVQPQTLSTPPPPQLFGALQLPQLICLPQPSEMDPQFLPC